MSENVTAFTAVKLVTIILKLTFKGLVPKKKHSNRLFGVVSCM